MFVASWAILLLVAWCKSAASNLTETAQANQDFIFNGVTKIRAPGTSSLITVFGEQAFPLVAGKSRHGIPGYMGAGGTFGKARMAAFTLDDCLYVEDTAHTPGGPTDQNRFLDNLYKWLAGGKTPNKTALIGKRRDRALKFLTKNDMNPTVIPLKELRKYKSLEDFDVVIIRDYIAVGHVPILQDYINGGGGIVAGINSLDKILGLRIMGHFASAFPLNMLSKDFGFVWTADYFIDRSWVHYDHGIFNVTYPALAGLTLLELWNSVKTAPQQPNRNGQLLHVFKLFDENVRSVPKDFFPTMSSFYAEAVFLTRPDLQPVPSPHDPISSYSDKYKLLLFDYLTAHVLKPEDVPKHPSSVYFPGAVTKKTAQPLVLRRNITLNKGQGTYHHTGMYAEAGKVVTVELAEYTSIEPPFIELRVGIGITDISGLPAWRRPNMQLRMLRFLNRTVSFNIPYGGTIYLEYFDPIIENAEPVSIKLIFSGAIVAPYFKLGETSVQEWRETIRNEPAPLTELVTENIILTVPSADIRTLEDPHLLLEFWTRAIDTMADFVQISRDRPTPIRMFFDVQLYCNCLLTVNGGVAYFLNIYSRHAVDTTYLQTGESRYFYYNLASQYAQHAFFFHRHATSPAMWNLFGLYFYDKVVGLRPSQAMEHLTPPAYQPKIRHYISTNLTFSHLLGDPWLTLTFYTQLKEKYGWEIFRETFVKYRNISPNKKPKDEEEIMNLWVLLLSKYVEQNLYDFHKSWGFPLGQNLGAQLSSLNYSMDPMRMEDLLALS